jgi:hypothetical protein
VFTEGDFVAPTDAQARLVRKPGQVLMAETLPSGAQRLTVQPFDGGPMWSMPSDRVTKSAPPHADRAPVPIRPPKHIGARQTDPTPGGNPWARWGEVNDRAWRSTRPTDLVRE